MKKALITGINGQDGGYLAEFLLERGYQVFGMERRSSTKIRINCQHLEDKITFVTGDLTDQNSLMRCLKESDPDEVYNLASQSFVGESWNTPEQTGDVTGLGALRMLEAIREYNKDIKFGNWRAPSFFDGEHHRTKKEIVEIFNNANFDFNIVLHEGDPCTGEYWNKVAKSVKYYFAVLNLK